MYDAATESLSDDPPDIAEHNDEGVIARTLGLLCDVSAVDHLLARLRFACGEVEWTIER